MRRLLTICVLSALAGAGVGWAILALARRDPPAASPPGVPRVAVPAPFALEPEAADPFGRWMCRRLFPSALKFDDAGRLEPAEASDLAFNWTVELSTTLTPPELLAELTRRVLPHPDDRLTPLLVKKQEAWAMRAPIRPLKDGRLELQAGAPPVGAIRALEELLTPERIDAARSRVVTRLRLVFPDAATAFRHRLRLTPPVQELGPEQLLVTTEEGVWRAARAWTRSPAARPSTDRLAFTIVPSLEEAAALLSAGEAESAFVTEGTGVPTGLTERRVLVIHPGKVPDRAMRERLLEGKPVDGVAVLTRDGDAVVPGLHVRIVPPAEFAALVEAGRYDAFVGSIVTGVDVDLRPWFDPKRGRLGVTVPEALEALEHELDPVRRAELEERLWARAAEERFVKVLSRRPILYAGRPPP